MVYRGLSRSQGSRFSLLTEIDRPGEIEGGAYFIGRYIITAFS